MIPSKKFCAQPIPASSASCTLPGFSTRRFLTKIMDKMTRTAIMIHVTTTDSEIFPRTGRVKTVSQFNSSISLSVRSPVLLPPLPLFSFHTLKQTPENESMQDFLHKKKSCSSSNPLNPFFTFHFRLPVFRGQITSPLLPGILPINMFPER